VKRKKKKLNSVKKKKLNKQKIIGTSVERSCYEPNKKKLQSFLKADQLEKIKEIAFSRRFPKQFSGN
jgi:hypothetical protein